MSLTVIAKLLAIKCIKRWESPLLKSLKYSFTSPHSNNATGSENTQISRAFS
jgi:hypothetical protein